MRHSGHGRPRRRHVLGQGLGLPLLVFDELVGGHDALPHALRPRLEGQAIKGVRGRLPVQKDLCLVGLPSVIRGNLQVCPQVEGKALRTAHKLVSRLRL